jgi:mannose-6-phosphate isomerase-like protein (cupin superfamily)
VRALAAGDGVHSPRLLYRFWSDVAAGARPGARSADRARNKNRAEGETPNVKRMIAAAALLLLAAAVSGAADSSKVTFVGHDQVAKGGTLVTAPNLSILMAHRDAPGMVEVHDKETDTIYVLAGSATFVTGGTMVGGSVTAPGQQRGADVQGGDAHALVKGDVIVVPAGVPHWFKEVHGSIDYYVVKVIAP